MEFSQKIPVSETKPIPTPRVWQYTLAFLFLALIWVVALELWIKPALLAIPGTAIAKRLGLYLLPPLLTVMAAYMLHVTYVRRKLGQQEEQAIEARVQEDAQRREERISQKAILDQKRFSLEILAVGVAVEYFQNGQVWEAIQKEQGKGSILSADPKGYPSALEEKEKAHREREAEVLDHVLEWLTDEWAIPTFLAGPTLQNPQMMALLESNLTEALGYGKEPGRKLKVVASLHDENPDGMFQEVFDFMDQHPEVPAVLVAAEDGMALRHCLRDEGTPELLCEGPRPRDAMTETVVAILLGRKDRVNAMRAFINADAKGEDPMKPYWEKDLMARSAGVFTTSEWLPDAWSRPLLEAFSQVSVIGCLHRPQFVRYQGQGTVSRAKSMQEAWGAALESLEEGMKNQRLFYDFGAVTQGSHLAPLSKTISALDPDFDVFDQGINLHRGLGDTGAASPFLGVALAAMASHRERGVSSSAFLRRAEGASLFMISPPPGAEKPAGTDPFEAADAHAEA